MIRLVQELSGHGLVSVTNVDNPLNGHCANYYRFLWHPWMQSAKDSDFYMAGREDEPPFVSEKRDYSKLDLAKLTGRESLDGLTITSGVRYRDGARERRRRRLEHVYPIDLPKWQAVAAHAVPP
ncbi:MAG TPA: hypothetical protein VIT00_03300 [Terrimicrobiaceae bacterium]